MLDKRRHRRGYVGFARKITPMETEQIEALVAANRRLITTFDDEYKAGWLLSDWSDTKWVTTNGKRTTLVNGVWSRTVDISWDIVLPNGVLFTAPQYAMLLNTVKKIAFLYREGRHGRKAPSIATWRSFCQIMLCIVRWMVLETKRYEIEKYGLTLLDQAGLSRLYSSVGKDGWTGALRIVELTLAKLYSAAIGEHCPTRYVDDPTNLPSAVVNRISNWLTENRHIGTRNNKGNVSRTFISQIISLPPSSVNSYSPRFAAFLRQFEPEMAEKNVLLQSTGQLTEYPSHRIASVIDATVASATSGPLKRLNTTMATIISLSDLLPNELPDGETLNLEKAKRIGLQHANIIGHTPIIPLDIGLKYLNESMRWVHIYGDDIVTYYLKTVKKQHQINNRSPSKSWAVYYKEIEKVVVPPSLRSIGFSGGILKYPVKSTGIDKHRFDITLTDLLEIWVGAVTTLIACMKPQRSSELQNLKRDCLLGTGPYYIVSELAKRTYREERAMIDPKPIPTIVARAIKQLQRLGNGLNDLLGEKDEYKASLLFYLPFADNASGRTKKISSLTLNRYMDRFYDYVALPPDKLGRRWYARVHEWRKWFLLLLFWSARFGALDAVRDIAGHVDREHVKAYLEREFPSIEFSSFEAEWAVDRLRVFDKTGISDVGEKIDALYQKVLDHFSVTGLEMIPFQEWTAYIKQLRSNDEFYLRPYAFVDEFGNNCHVVGFQSCRHE